MIGRTGVSSQKPETVPRKPGGVLRRGAMECSGGSAEYTCGGKLGLSSRRDRVRERPAGNRKLADGRGAGIVASGRASDDLASLVGRSATPTRVQPRDGRIPGSRHPLE